jgi:hypothetical protein
MLDALIAGIIPAINVIKLMEKITIKILPKLTPKTSPLSNPNSFALLAI